MYEPPEPGMAAPSSLQIIPSEIVMTNATSQPSIACGPPSVDNNSGIVMNGPMPIMLVMFSAVASNNPKRRKRCGSWFGCSVFILSVDDQIIFHFLNVLPRSGFVPEPRVASTLGNCEFFFQSGTGCDQLTEQRCGLIATRATPGVKQPRAGNETT